MILIQWGGDHFLPISIVENLQGPPLLGFEVCDDVIFSQSENDCPVILCPVIPHTAVQKFLIFVLWSIILKFQVRRDGLEFLPEG